MIRLAIVGCNYGRAVQLPAFRADSRCRVVALAGSDAARTAELARQSDIPEAFGDWARMIERPDIDAVAIAVPPRLQPEIAVAALKLGKPVFVEKPMAADLAGAAVMARQAGPVPAMIDFTFTELMAWQKARSLLESGAIGRLRHVDVLWNVENASTRLRMKNWKTSGEAGGGALGNLRQPLAALSRVVLRTADRPVGAAVRPAGRSGVRNRRDAQPRVPVRRIGQPDHELRVVSRQRPPSRVLRRRRHAAAGQSHHRLHARLCREPRAAARRR